LYTMGERTRCQRSILIWSVSLAADLCVLLCVISKVSAQLHFLEVT
jgi:hypothetical protein